MRVRVSSVDRRDGSFSVGFFRGKMGLGTHSPETRAFSTMQVINFKAR